MKTSPKKIKRLLTLEAAATKGEWWVLHDEPLTLRDGTVMHDGGSYHVLYGDQEGRIAALVDGDCPQPNAANDASLIAESRNALPDLLDSAARLSDMEARIERVRELRDWYKRLDDGDDCNCRSIGARNKADAVTEALEILEGK